MNMNKLFLTLIFLVAFGFCSIAQMNIYPKGAYMSFDEIINKTPSQQFDLNVIKRTKGDIKMVGGNDYKLVSIDKSVKKKILKKEIWAYSLGDTLYLNCFHYKVQPWYTCVISDGNYLVFKGGISQYVDEQKKQMQMGYYFGVVGGAISGAKLAMLRFLYVIDKKTNQINTVTPETLRELLIENNELLAQFDKEVNKDT
jgi:hypothetical protein